MRTLENAARILTHVGTPRAPHAPSPLSLSHHPGLRHSHPHPHRTRARFGELYRIRSCLGISLGVLRASSRSSHCPMWTAEQWWFPPVQEHARSTLTLHVAAQAPLFIPSRPLGTAKMLPLPGWGDAASSSTSRGARECLTASARQPTSLPAFAPSLHAPPERGNSRSPARALDRLPSRSLRGRGTARRGTENPAVTLPAVFDILHAYTPRRVGWKVPSDGRCECRVGWKARCMKARERGGIMAPRGIASDT
ncbi:hypothetical protein B0H12DRAFT_1232278 [Mycena haematopus]|nr:hypothetical protein B0H12DRAFT_1232278 [Mycena haematopus]